MMRFNGTDWISTQGGGQVPHCWLPAGALDAGRTPDCTGILDGQGRPGACSACLGCGLFLTMPTADADPPEDRSVTAILQRAVAKELAELDEELDDARDRRDRSGVVTVVEAKARIKLEVAATAIRVEANVRRLLAPSMPEGLRQAAGHALQKLQGLGPAGRRGGPE
jgi:hypothetical protein